MSYSGVSDIPWQICEREKKNPNGPGREDETGCLFDLNRINDTCLHYLNDIKNDHSQHLF